jgi:hypothetical protein
VTRPAIRETHYPRRLVCLLPDALMAQVEAEAHRRGVTVSELVREWLREAADSEALHAGLARREVGR